MGSISAQAMRMSGATFEMARRQILAALTDGGRGRFASGELSQL
jgi:hypothetical protein